MTSFAAATKTRPSVILARLGRHSRPFALIYALAVLYLGACIVAKLAGLFVPDIRAPIFYLKYGFLIALIFGLLYAIRHVVRLLLAGVSNPIAVIRQNSLRFLATDDRPIRAFHTVALFVCMLVPFSTIKSSIPTIHPFSWDEWLAHADQALLGGYDAYQWTSVLFGGDTTLAIICFFYNLWLLVVIGWVVWIACLRSYELQLRCLFAILLGWLVGGNILATWWSSVGPCFVQLLNGDTTFAPLMTRLREADERAGLIFAINAQHLLWEGYISTHGIISGISAMPSLHVMFSVFLVCTGWRYGWTIRFATTSFAVIIWIGSIQLAWHYAVDGLVGGGLALLFWGVAGSLSKRSLAWASQASGDPERGLKFAG